MRRIDIDRRARAKRMRKAKEEREMNGEARLNIVKAAERMEASIQPRRVCQNNLIEGIIEARKAEALAHAEALAKAIFPDTEFRAVSNEEAKEIIAELLQGLEQPATYHEGGTIE